MSKSDINFGIYEAAGGQPAADVPATRGAYINNLSGCTAACRKTRGK